MNKPVISKEHFLACIKTLQEVDNMACDIDAIAKKYDRDDFIYGYAFSDSKTETRLLETLEIALNDTHHFISWFCLETDYGRNEGHYFFPEPIIHWDGVKYRINSAEELYDFIVEHEN